MLTLLFTAGTISIRSITFHRCNNVIAGNNNYLVIQDSIFLESSINMATSNLSISGSTFHNGSTYALHMGMFFHIFF